MPISLPDSIDDSLFDDFFNEFSEAYHFCEVKLVELERTPENQDLVNQIFRAVHTVKGNFSFVGLSALTPLLQATEDILGAVREGSLRFDNHLSDIVLLTMDKANETMGDLVSTGVSPITLAEINKMSRLIARVPEASAEEYVDRVREAIIALDPGAEYVSPLNAGPDPSLYTPEQHNPENHPLLQGDLSAHLEPQYSKLFKRYNITLHADILFFLQLMKPIEARSIYWSGRSKRLLVLALGMNRLAGSPVDATQLSAAVLMHDISMAFLPLELLHKAESFSAEERNMVEQHTQSSFELLQKMQIWEEASQIVYQHHERSDGRGYPKGLGEQSICDGAKILAIVDTYDAIMHARAHTSKVKRPFIRAVLEINSQSGTQFSPTWVQHFNTVARKLQQLQGN
ncbi:MAG: HD domain-containing protein [Hahellaceae bacterium]|nr:HD domain-containing protein [Hahellaceae bacterium]